MGVSYVHHMTIITKVGVSYVHHMTITKVGASYVHHINDDTPEVDSFSHGCYQALSSPRF